MACSFVGNHGKKYSISDRPIRVIKLVVIDNAKHVDRGVERGGRERREREGEERGGRERRERGAGEERGERDGGREREKERACTDKQREK